MVDEPTINIRVLLGRAELRNLPMIVIGDSGFFVHEYTSYDWEGKIDAHRISLGGRVDGISCLPYIPMEHTRVC